MHVSGWAGVEEGRAHGPHCNARRVWAVDSGTRPRVPSARRQSRRTLGAACGCNRTLLHWHDLTPASVVSAVCGTAGADDAAHHVQPQLCAQGRLRGTSAAHGISITARPALSAKPCCCWKPLPTCQFYTWFDELLQNSWEACQVRWHRVCAACTVLDGEALCSTVTASNPRCTLLMPRQVSEASSSLPALKKRPVRPPVAPQQPRACCRWL